MKDICEFTERKKSFGLEYIPFNRTAMNLCWFADKRSVPEEKLNALRSLGYEVVIVKERLAPIPYPRINIHA